MRDKDLENMMDENTKSALRRIWKTNIPSRFKDFG